MLKSNLWGYGDANMLVKGIVTMNKAEKVVPEVTPPTAKATDERNKEVT